MTDLLNTHRSAVQALCRRFRVRQLDVFGSAASGRMREDSDVDFLVEFEPMDSGYADRYFGLLEGLQSIFNRPVDLVVASAIRNPFFKRSVEASRAMLYAA